MTIEAGDRFPSAELRRIGEKGPEKVSTDELLKGRRVVLFFVPGAFTPTCSKSHLPGFVQQADALRAKGIDSVGCVAVNDAFVMNAWGRDQGVGDKVMMLADGNGELTRALGLERDSSGYGMGTRSRRFSMLVDDGVVKALYLDEPGEFKISSAEHMLSHL